MAGSIRTPPVTREYERGWDEAHAPHAPAPPRKVREHACEWCGRVMRYDDQQCACTSKRGW